jgi:hypothetical protein
MSIDSAVGECFDKAYTFFKRYESVYKNPEAQ